VRVVNLTGAMGGDDSDADANLISAAPDLLAALERLVADTPPMPAENREQHMREYISRTLEQAQAAINKAKGIK